MKKAYVFPGQGAQFPGMGKESWDAHPQVRDWYAEADEILGFPLSKVMFEGTEEELKETKVTQPAIFVQSVVQARLAGDTFKPDAVAGHSLGEFSALVAAGALSFREGLQLVNERALAMQAACELTESTMAAIVGLDDEVVEKVCAEIDDVVVPANYNSPGQLVISGSLPGIQLAVEKLQAAGAKRALILAVGGAFHSPLMEPARERLAAAIKVASFTSPVCPIYQNVHASPESDPDCIRENLIAQLTAPVRWTQTIQNMFRDGLHEFVEVGGKGVILRGLIRRIEPSATCSAL
ncbi:MAG: ACP S-malonyltransferase [Saprospiraceae bacterium]|nr:ACP S-malonyltransferase [Saprospiraceae bacterium]